MMNSSVKVDQLWRSGEGCMMVYVLNSWGWLNSDASTWLIIGAVRELFGGHAIARAWRMRRRDGIEDE
jgi:hypothetical protein